MITVERLADADFDALQSVEEGFVPNPESSIAVVAREDGEIIGRMMLLNLAHVEGAWVHERYRGGKILERMTREIELQASKAGLATVFVYSQTEEMDGYIERLGYERSPLRVFRKDL